MSERRFLSVRISTWDGIAGLSAAVGVCALLLTAIFAVVELRDRREAARAQATLDLLDVWETRGFRTAYRTLASTFSAEISSADRASLLAAQEDGTILARLYERAANEVLSQQGAVQAFEDVVYFFERVHLCTETKLCSASATDTFFGPPMRDFARSFASKLEAERSINPLYAEGLANLN